MVDELTNKPSISFVVPALNEVGNIAATVETILDAAGRCCGDFEIVLVNDGSTDGTGQTMDQLAQQYSPLRVVHNERNLGYGGAFKRGASVAQKDYVIRICADNVTPAPMIENILSKVGQADLVIPYLANPEFRSWGRRIASWGFTLIINTLVGLRVPYYNHAVVFPRQRLQSITISTNGFTYSAEAVAKLLKMGCSYVTVGTREVPRISGKSSAVRPKNLWEVLLAIPTLVREVRRIRPLMPLDQK